MKVFQFHDDGINKRAVIFGFDADDPADLSELRSLLQVATTIASRNPRLAARIEGACAAIEPMLRHAAEEAAKPNEVTEPGEPRTGSGEKP